MWTFKQNLKNVKNPWKMKECLLNEDNFQVQIKEGLDASLGIVYRKVFAFLLTSQKGQIAAPVQEHKICQGSNTVMLGWDE